MFFCENASDAAPNTATSSTFAATAASKPFMLGTSTGYATPGLRRMRAMTSRAVRHLRNPLGRHERRGLDRGQPCVAQAVDEPDLDVGRDRALLVLQPVARADLDDRLRGPAAS